MKAPQPSDMTQSDGRLIAPGYMPGWGNDFETEALPGALPEGMNSPQKCNYGLYGEQLSGTAFNANLNWINQNGFGLGDY